MPHRICDKILYCDSSLELTVLISHYLKLTNSQKIHLQGHQLELKTSSVYTLVKPVTP